MHRNQTSAVEASDGLGGCVDSGVTVELSPKPPVPLRLTVGGSRLYTEDYKHSAATSHVSSRILVGSRVPLRGRQLCAVSKLRRTILRSLTDSMSFFCRVSVHRAQRADLEAVSPVHSVPADLAGSDGSSTHHL